MWSVTTLKRLMILHFKYNEIQIHWIHLNNSSIVSLLMFGKQGILNVALDIWELNSEIWSLPRSQKCLDEVNNSVQTLLTQMYFVNAIRYSSDQPFDKLIILEDSSGFTFWTHTVQHQRINNKYTVNQKEKLTLKKLIILFKVVSTGYYWSVYH